MLMHFEIIIALLGLMANNSTFGIVNSCMQNLFTYTNLRNHFLPAHIPSQYVVPSCYLIFENHIGVNYDHLFLLSEIDFS